MYYLYFNNYIIFKLKLFLYFIKNHMKFVIYIAKNCDSIYQDKRNFRKFINLNISNIKYNIGVFFISYY